MNNQQNISNEEIGIRIGMEDNNQIKMNQAPGKLPIKINNYQTPEGKLEFYGVNEQGASVSGEGVAAAKIDYNHNQETVALFNISNLVETGQFTESTVEGVITVNGAEIGRGKIDNNPSIYLG